MSVTISISIYDGGPEWINNMNKDLKAINEGCKNYYEILLIDDRKDQSKSLKDFIDPIYKNYRIIPHGENKGILATRVSGIRNCKSDYIWMIDMDDDIQPYDFEKVNKIQSDVILFVYSYYSDKKYESRIVLSEYIRDLLEEIGDYSLIYRIHSDIDRIMVYRLIYKCYVCNWYKIMNVNFLKKVLEYIDLTKFEHMTVSEDVVLNIGIMGKLNSIALINDVLPYHYKNYEKSNMSYTPWHYEGTKKVLNKMSDEIVNSWKRIYQNTPNSIWKEAWFKDLQRLYSQVDFTTFNEVCNDE